MLMQFFDKLLIVLGSVITGVIFRHCCWESRKQHTQGLIGQVRVGAFVVEQHTEIRQGPDPGALPKINKNRHRQKWVLFFFHFVGWSQKKAKGPKADDNSYVLAGLLAVLAGLDRFELFAPNLALHVARD
jgi:hypothetical protein